MHMRAVELRFGAARQLLRYGIVGIASNAALFLLYLALTRFGMNPIPAMTLLFALGAVQTFIFNRNWSFGHRGNVRQSFCRYVVVYSSAYMVNLLALYTLAGRLGYRHETVQAAMIVIIAVATFICQRYWVFRGPRPHSLPSVTHSVERGNGQ